MSNLLKTLWLEPRVPDAPGPRKQDWLLVAVIAVLAILEGAFREDVVWRSLSVGLALVFVLTLPWRRTLPAYMIAITFGPNAAVQTYALFNGIDWTGLYSTVLLLILPYALLRWGSGKEAFAGLGVIGLTFATTIVVGDTPPGEIVGACLFILFPSALGASARYRDAAHREAKEQVRLLEREQLARELHDTVAHYVSAIAIQAQAGRAQAAMRPEAPLEALEVIESAASRTLAEMRNIVRVLRSDGQAPVAPAASVSDIERLALDDTIPLQIDVTLSGELDNLDSTLAATLFRLTQESITNAVRHAKAANCVLVQISGDVEQIHLKIEDDGEQVPQQQSPGLGLQGMSERVALLGGAFRAGPGERCGWIVEAALPRRGRGSGSGSGLGSGSLP